MTAIGTTEPLELATAALAEMLTVQYMEQPLESVLVHLAQH